MSGVFVVVGAAAALATFDTNDIGCRGKATITAPDGSTFKVSAEDDRATIPREGTAKWKGGTGTPVTEHHGAVKLDLGPFGITIWDWADDNKDGDTVRKGTTELPEALKQVPPGLYSVSGFHTGKEGSCSGHILVEIEGSPLSTAAGWVALGGTVLAAAGTLVAGLARRLVR